MIKFDNSSYTDTYTHIPGFWKTEFKQKKKKQRKFILLLGNLTQ